MLESGNRTVSILNLDLCTQNDLSCNQGEEKSISLDCKRCVAVMWGAYNVTAANNKVTSCYATDGTHLAEDSIRTSCIKYANLEKAEGSSSVFSHMEPYYSFNRIPSEKGYNGWCFQVSVKRALEDPPVNLADLKGTLTIEDCRHPLHRLPRLPRTGWPFSLQRKQKLSQSGT